MILKRNTHTFKWHPFCAKKNLPKRKHIFYENEKYWNAFGISLFSNIIVCGIQKSFAIQNPSNPLYLSLVGRLILTESEEGELEHISFFSLGINVFMNFE